MRTPRSSLGESKLQATGWKQATMVPATMCIHTVLAGFQCPAHSLNNSSGTGVLQQISRVSRAAWPRADPRLCPPSCSSRSSGTQSVACLSLCASLLHQGKGLFLARGLSSHTLPFKEWSAGSAAGTHSNSLLIQRLQKKKITGVSLLFPPSLSLGLHFSRFTPEFILTITRQQS